MLEDLVALHEEVMKTTPRGFQRYLYAQVNWSSQGICILGDRGVGKTTLICQHLLQTYQTPERALYISADNISTLSMGLFKIAREFFAFGGEALYIDEVHKYPNWSLEIKNILDTYKTRQVIFSASSSLDLKQSKADLSRRVVYHRLPGLSFREYLKLAHQIDIATVTLQDIVENHVRVSTRLQSHPIQRHFREYLEHGYYPFFTEGLNDYFSKVNNVIEKVIFEDIAVVYNLKQSTLPILKKILWLVATSGGMVLNIDKTSKNLGVSREMIYNCLEYLCQSGLLNEVFHASKGNALVRKPSKLYLNNTNLLSAIHASLKLRNDIGHAREAFFVNQLLVNHSLSVPEKGDFLIDHKILVEIGGKGKTDKQIQGESKAYLALDDVSIGFGKKIPLYLFGLLY